MVGQPWLEGRYYPDEIVKLPDEVLAGIYIGYERGRLALYSPAYTKRLKGRHLGLPFHSIAIHKQLLRDGGIKASHWLPGLEAKRLLIEVHGLSAKDEESDAE